MHKKEQRTRESSLVSAALYGPAHQLHRDDRFPCAYRAAGSYKYLLIYHSLHYYSDLVLN